jgi:hypothetical protein
LLASAISGVSDHLYVTAVFSKMPFFSTEQGKAKTENVMYSQQQESIHPRINQTCFAAEDAARFAKFGSGKSRASS